VGTFGFQVQDSGGTANGGQDTAAPATITLNVTAVNDAPLRSAASLTAITANEDSATSTAASLGLGSVIYGPGGGAVLVDFTHPSVVFEHTRAAIAYGVHPVIGTTGLSPEQLADLASFAEKASVGGAVIPNFSVGMVLLQQAAAAAARFYDFAELTELHHNRKADAPSGTCIKTAELMEELGKTFNPLQVEEHETLVGCRGGQRESGLRLHSVRLPGLVAHQEVMFGAPGETYTLRHDTIDRSAYMPGVLLTVRRVRSLEGLIYGLERLL